MMQIGILDLLTNEAMTLVERIDAFLVRKQYVSLTPQAIAVWCRQMGHRVHYATYYGFGDPKAKLPHDLDAVFISTHTPRAPLAYALSKLYRREGVRTIIGGPHAKAYPHDCLRYFDLVVLECDPDLIADIINGRFEPHSVVSSLKPYDDTPTLEERLPEIRASTFVKGRPYPGSIIPMLASMGCPYSCNFCIDWNSRYRALSAERLVQDLRFAAQHFPGVKLGFDDPNFGIRFDETMTSFESVGSKNHNPYIIESSLGNLRPDRLQRLRNTHCLAVAPGIESWTQYGNKAGVGKVVNNDKLEQVVTQFQMLHEYVPYLQANFIFGLDDDAGDIPFELTKELMRRAPFVWTYMNIPYAFGGTPLYTSFLQEGRILKTMPFTFYIVPYLTVILKNYDPISYFQQMVELYTLATSDQLLKLRLRESTQLFANYTHHVRTFLTKPMLAAFRKVLARLQTDTQYLSFHRGESDVLPDVYVREYQRQLGKYAELMPIAESQPFLSADAIIPANLGVPVPVSTAA